jgi:hypothetical protein
MSEPVTQKKRLDWKDVVSQIAVFAGALAVVGMNTGAAWGPLVGLATQPFWFYTTWKHRQWGVFAASVIYAIGWSIGTYRYLFGA